MPKHRKPITGAAFAGNYALTSAEDRLIVLWDVAKGTVAQSFIEHPDGVSSCAFAYDNGKLIALSGGQDGVLRAWGIPGGEPLKSLGDHRGAVSACAGITA